jgi:processive 1,2-diacylglycerol beta-glucosyltransferase
VKTILILTAAYGEGHNSAARGLQAGLAQVAPDIKVECHDIFAEAFGGINDWIRNGYLTLITNWPRSWGVVYRWLDRKSDFNGDFVWFGSVKKQLALLLDRFQPDVIVSVFPAYPHLLQQIRPARKCRSIVVITDSITINAIWYRCEADAFLVPNSISADVLRAVGIPNEKIRAFGFPVSPKFVDLPRRAAPSDGTRPRVLYMINASGRARETTDKLSALDIELTVAVGRNSKLRRMVETAVSGRNIEVLGWIDDLPKLLGQSHLLIAKAGGATVQEAIAAGCPMIINHIVSGQEEGNARLILQTNSGAVAMTPTDVVTRVQEVFADDGKLWREWARNIGELSRPRAALDIAEFLSAL